MAKSAALPTPKPKNVTLTLKGTALNGMYTFTAAQLTKWISMIGGGTGAATGGKRGRPKGSTKAQQAQKAGAGA